MTVAVATMSVFAANVDRITAQAKAEAFLKSQATASGKLMAPGSINFVSERTITNSANVTVPVMYIFNTTDRFVIVSGEDRAVEILAVGDEPLDLNNIPANMQAWLDFYQQQIEYLQDRPGLVVEKLNAPNRAQNVSPMLTAKWDQTAPFWNQCVFNNTQCLTGCPATSLSQVFYYWKYPTGATPSLSGYTSNGYTVPALGSTTFDWGNMKDYYGWNGNSGTAAQKAAVATLMRYVGQAEKVSYGDADEGSGIPSNRTDLISTACKTFGYDNNVQAIYKQNSWGQTLYSDSQWASMIQAELTAGHPIVYCALSNNGGHAFNVDGYTVSGNLYHVNWGWSGSGNGDFALNAFTIDGDTFNQYQSMVIGIQPPGGVITFPVLTVEPESLDFGSIRTGETVTRTFQVSGINLLGDITFSKSTGASCYTVSPETLTAEQVSAGATVTVTYAPTTGGTHEGTISVMSSGAETKSVAVTGSATVVPVLTAEPSEMSFTTELGQPVTDTFMLYGYNLTGTVYLSVVNSTGGFSINKSNVTKNAAMNGVEVTVTYSPASLGNHSARVMLRTAGADTIYVALNGTATFNKYVPVMLPANEQYISGTSFRADWTDETPVAGVSSYRLQCDNVAGGESTHTYNDITGKFYTIENLTAGATYTYKVKAFYIDGTESDWSNIQQVTLIAAHGFDPGDVNHDHNVSISDVTALIDYLLGSGDICTICGDVNGDDSISIGDVTALIDMLLAN